MQPPSDTIIVGLLASLPASAVALYNIYRSWRADRRAAAQRAANQQQNAAKLDHIEKLTNSSMTAAISRIAELEATLKSMIAERNEYLGSLRVHPENTPPV